MNLGVSKVEADEYGFPEYHVTFDGSKLQSNDYSREEIKKVLEGMQPGDKAEITWVLSNNSDKDVDWWMSNDTMKTFEEDKRNTVEGGNYTYKLNYVDTKNELDKIYDNDVHYTVTLKSHLFENDGKYVFNDIIQSPEVWTVVNGESYGIILENVTVDEVNQNNIYEATVRYGYSMNPSII